MTCCHFILSSHPAGGGTWAMTDCCGNVWDLLTSVNDPDHCIRMAYVDHPGVLCKPSGWYVYKCRLIFLEVVRKNVSCVLYRKIRMRVTRMTMRVMCHRKMHAMCHCKMRATCSRREGSLHLCSSMLLPLFLRHLISFYHLIWNQRKVKPTSTSKFIYFSIKKISLELEIWLHYSWL